MADKAKMVIAIGGPPHSGKSVFLAELYRQTLAKIGSSVFLQRACPDGEGMWSAEADQDLVKQIRRKGQFDAPTMNFYFSSIEGLKKTKEIVLIDLGGMKSLENILILAHCSDLVVLSSKKDQLDKWGLLSQELPAIVRALKTQDTDFLLSKQKEGVVDIIPPGKLEQFPDDEAKKEEISRRVAVLHQNFEPTIEGLAENEVNVLARLGSRLLTEEERQQADELISNEKPLTGDLISNIDISEVPYRGEMVDLDRDRSSITYAEAIAQTVAGINNVREERETMLEGNEDHIQGEKEG